MLPSHQKEGFSNKAILAILEVQSGFDYQQNMGQRSGIKILSYALSEALKIGSSKSCYNYFFNMKDCSDGKIPCKY